MSEPFFPYPYQTAEQREISTLTPNYLCLTPYRVQGVIYNLIKNNWLNNDPAKSGYPFSQRYSVNPADSGVFLAMSYNWVGNPTEVNPSIIVRRGSANITAPTIGQAIQENSITSSKTKLHIVTMTCQICIIANPVTMCEEVAEFTLQPLITYEHQILNDFKFRRFRLSNISTPQLYPQAKDGFIVIGSVETVFDSTQVIVGDDLKLKTVSYDIFLGLINQPPLQNQ